MKKIKALLGPVIFITFTIALFGMVISSSPKILILHSYNVDYIWTNTLDKGLEIELKKRPTIRSKTFYMNTKDAYTKSSEKLAIRTIEQYDPDIIVAFDDNAQRFLSRYYLDTDIPIVFAGVNNGVEQYNYIDNKQITGVFERKPIKGILFVMSQLNIHRNTPDKKNVLLLSDNAFSSQLDKDHLSQQDWQGFNFQAQITNTLDEWKQAVLSLADKKIDYLLVTGYRKLTSNETVNQKQYVSGKLVAKWTQENSPVQVIATNIFSSQDGFVLSVGESPYEQVKIAMELVDKIVEQGNTLSTHIPYQYSDFYGIGINEQALKNSSDKIPLFFESFAKISHNVF